MMIHTMKRDSLKTQKQAILHDKGLYSQINQKSSKILGVTKIKINLREIKQKSLLQMHLTIIKFQILKMTKKIY
jgi:hypothetical protein